MKYIEAPQEYVGEDLVIFLAGGITSCPEWQDTFKEGLEEWDLALINPRRIGFDVNDSKMEKDQITWEHKYLERADIVVFWFPCETLCPITLLELGVMLEKSQYGSPELFIGCHPEYKRKRDVAIQTELRIRGIKIADSKEELLEQVQSFLRTVYMTKILPKNEHSQD